MTGLLTATTTADSAEDFVARASVVSRTFDHRTQDSGNVSWLVEAEGLPLFVKSAGPVLPVRGAAEPVLDHAGRVRLLENAVELARSCDHSGLANLRNVISTATGPALVYDVAPGELLHVPSDERNDPASPYQRFAKLPGDRMLSIFDVLIVLHVALASQGWVACDLYDGCLIVSSDDRLTVVDLDTYRRGPFTNTMGRMFGSTRFMAPEELTLGATIDQRTTVFTLGRLATHFTTRLSDDLADFVGPAAGSEVLHRACAPDPADRFPDVGELGAAWLAAR